jgi:acetyl-CoA/propionyl-CoA carboxylase biotin carboxyl carrier protein
MPASQAGGAGPAQARRTTTRTKHSAGSGKPGQPTEAVTTPMQGTVLRVLVRQGQEVAEGDVICIVEAMKMENEVAAHRAGVVRTLSVTEGQSVDADQVIAIVS